jgi:hypothetical protein
MFPFYEKLGETPPPKQCADHKVLMQALERTSTEMVDLVSMNSNGDGESSCKLRRTKATDVVNMFDSLFEIMTEHLTEEEEYWPGIIKEYGKV